MPEAVLVEASGNIIKNVKSVVVPNTGGLKGIEASAAAGIVAGKAERVLEVIADVTEEQKTDILKYMETHPISVVPAEGDVVFDIILTLTLKVVLYRLTRPACDHHIQPLSLGFSRVCGDNLHLVTAREGGR